MPSVVAGESAFFVTEVDTAGIGSTRLPGEGLRREGDCIEAIHQSEYRHHAQEKSEGEIQRQEHGRHDIEGVSTVAIIIMPQVMRQVGTGRTKTGLTLLKAACLPPDIDRISQLTISYRY